ncbi:MAG: hypothetical protein KDD78_06820 [Caldilineaceae bacterium]|nr:hypothetical protein [Caldilineaceae bacterium]
MQDPRLHLFGIRHHGPGSARALLTALHELRPDAVLVEGPADANPHLHWVGHTDLEPPVALVVYRPDAPNRSASFPFAQFSPEFHAIRYGLAHDVLTQFIDLPQSHMLAVDANITLDDGMALQQLAAAAGFASYERWWNDLVEQRQDRRALFPAILELMTAARNAPSAPHDVAPTPTHAPGAPTTPPASVAAGPDEGVLLSQRREAHMRVMMRAALAAGHQRVAVICGAWHAPALADLASFAERDEVLLADLITVATDVAWVPWTYGRLATFAGYGAGVPSPGWYHHLWEMASEADDGAEDEAEDAALSSTAAAVGEETRTLAAEADDAQATAVAVVWAIRMAELLRERKFDTSAAHVIETVRLAEALAALRGLTRPGLPELDDAARTVMCAGQDEPMQLIRRKLVVGERMGHVPPDAPMTPLQRDLHASQRALHLYPNPEPTRLTLDLRHERHLARSVLLHRLALLEVPWGKRMASRRGGSFQEAWQLQWRPELSVRVVMASAWGNTVVDAARGRAVDLADHAETLAALTTLLDQVILADLPGEVAVIMQRMEDLTAVQTDIPHLMEALPPLVRILRYGSVRRMDRDAIRHAVDVMTARICLGLPAVCRDVSDGAATDLLDRVQHMHAVIGTLRTREHNERWHGALNAIAEDEHSHPLLVGGAVRLLMDAGQLARQVVAQRLRGALSVAVRGADELRRAGFWLEGFLKGSDRLLIHDLALWQLLDEWLMELSPADYLALLPLLRRAFAGYGEPARDELLARVRTTQGPALEVGHLRSPGFDSLQAEAVVPYLATLLGVAP